MKRGRKKGQKSPLMEAQKRTATISDQVLVAIANAPNKKNLCKWLNISFPTLKNRLVKNDWTGRERMILKQRGIISKLYDVDRSTDG